MRIERYLVFSLLLLIGLSACDSGFEALNTDPNNPTEVDPGALLPYAAESAMDLYLSAGIGMEFAPLVVQHWARISITEPDRYSFSDGKFESFWKGMYAGPLRDFAEIERLGKANGNPNYEAIGLILKTWTFSVLTDAFGDIPYSEALRGEESIRFPTFDPQAAIYESMVADLERAAGLIEVGGPSVSNDVIYDGDMAKWRKLANALRLRLLMRMSDREDVGSAVQQLVDEGDLFASNADNAILQYLDGTPNRNPFRELPIGRREQFRISKTMVEMLKDLDDPRLAVYADTTEYLSPTKRANDSLYVGTPNGQTDEQASKLDSQKRSRIGSFFRQATLPAPFMTYAEVSFHLAEAAERGLITGNPEAHYEQGINASLTQHGVPVGGYLSNADVAFDPSRALEQIGVQKWIALYGQGLDAWSEWRRTGYPELTPAIANLNDDRIPERMRYPTELQITNPDSHQAAIDRQGPNDLNTRVWWDVESNND